MAEHHVRIRGTKMTRKRSVKRHAVVQPRDNSIQLSLLPQAPLPSSKFWYRRSKAQGLCGCGKELPIGKGAQCAQCRRRGREYCARLRKETVSAYGGRCQCPGGCDVDIAEFLSIDHIFNDGKAHRKKIGMSTAIYRWLKREGWPKDRFRLLCYNCNFARAKYKVCPHESTVAK
jgi:hypothetical protein